MRAAEACIRLSKRTRMIGSERPDARTSHGRLITPPSTAHFRATTLPNLHRSSIRRCKPVWRRCSPQPPRGYAPRGSRRASTRSPRIRGIGCARVNAAHDDPAVWAPLGAQRGRGRAQARAPRQIAVDLARQVAATRAKAAAVQLFATFESDHPATRASRTRRSCAPSRTRAAANVTRAASRPRVPGLLSGGLRRLEAERMAR